MNSFNFRINLILYIKETFIFKYFSCLKSWYVNDSRVFRDHLEIESKLIQSCWTRFFKRVRFWARFAAVFFMKNRVYFRFFISRLTVSSSRSKQEKSILKTVVNRIREIAIFTVVTKSRWDEISIVMLNSRERIFETRDLKNKAREFVCRIIVFKKSCDVMMRCVFCDELEIDTWTSSNKFAWLCVEIALESSRSRSRSRSRIMIELDLISSNDDTKKNRLICENRNSLKRYLTRKTVSRFNDKSIIIEKRSREYTRKNDCN